MSGCARCGENYDPRLNVGRWRCFLHPGRVDHGTWSCCGVHIDYPPSPEAERGCRRADHDIDPDKEKTAYVRAYVGIPALPEATLPTTFTTVPGFTSELVAKGLDRDTAQQTSLLMQNRAITDALFYVNEASAAVARAAATALVAAQERRGGNLDMGDPFFGLHSHSLGGLDYRALVARLLKFLEQSDDRGRREALHDALLREMNVAYPALFPLIHLVRRYSTATEAWIPAALPLARYFSALHVDGHSS